MQEDRQKSEALIYFRGVRGESAAADLAVQQPLEPPLAALRDAMLADTSALQRKAADLQECLEVCLQPANPAAAAAAHSGVLLGMQECR